MRYLTYTPNGTSESITIRFTRHNALVSLSNLAILLEVNTNLVMQTYQELIDKTVLNPSSRSSFVTSKFDGHSLDEEVTYDFDKDAIMAIGFSLNPHRLLPFRRWMDEQLLDYNSAPERELHSLFRKTTGKPKLNSAYVAFVDLLGYREKIEQSTDDSADALLNALYLALEGAALRLEHRDADILTTQVRYFSDCVSLITPIRWEDDPSIESEFGSIIVPLAHWQLSMVLSGFFVRGGLAFGRMYTDRFSIFGKAHLEAYDLEQLVAKYPRIVLSNDTKKLVKRQLGSYAENFVAPQQVNLLVDSDGEIFLNYLCALWDSPGAYPPNAIEIHRDLILNELSNQVDTKILGKYKWAASYHDWFCRLPENEEFGYRRFTIGEEVGKYADLRTTLEAEFQEEG